MTRKRVRTKASVMHPSFYQPASASVDSAVDIAVENFVENSVFGRGPVP